MNNSIKITTLKLAKKRILRHAETGEGYRFVCINVDEVVRSSDAPNWRELGDARDQIRVDINEYIHDCCMVETYMQNILGQDHDPLETRLQMIDDLIYLYEVNDES